jgi:hypothetical protein
MEVVSCYVGLTLYNKKQTSYRCVLYSQAFLKLVIFDKNPQILHNITLTNFYNLKQESREIMDSSKDWEIVVYFNSLQKNENEKTLSMIEQWNGVTSVFLGDKAIESTRNTITDRGLVYVQDKRAQDEVFARISALPDVHYAVPVY